MPRIARLAVWTTFVLLAPSVSIAQIGGSGSIQGTVLDPSKAALPGATVTATNVATGIDTVRQTTECRRVRADAAAARRLSRRRCRSTASGRSPATTSSSTA